MLGLLAPVLVRFLRLGVRIAVESSYPLRRPRAPIASHTQRWPLRLHNRNNSIYIETMEMDERQAVNAFAALAQETRLRIVRQLVAAGPDGVAAGSIAEAMGAPASSMSFHLKELERAGLVHSRRAGRSIIYSATLSSLSNLITFLMRDCCSGHPEICSPALEALKACCSPVLEPADV